MSMSSPTLLAGRDKQYEVLQADKASEALLEDGAAPGGTALGPSEIVRRSQLAGAAWLVVALASVGGLLLQHGVLDLGACVAFGYVSFVFVFQSQFMEYPALEAHVVGVLLAGLAAMWAPTVLGRVWAEEVAVRVACWATDAVIVVSGYRWMVRGPCHGPLGQLDGKTYVITGCNTGIGYETAMALARAGGTIVFACRSEPRAREAMENLLADAAGAVRSDQLVFFECDVSSFASVRAFAERFGASGLSIDALILNAGVMLSSRRLSADGFEMTMATNHLGHFLLVQLMLPSMLKAEAQGRTSRVVVVGSNMCYLHSAFDFSELAKVDTDVGRQAFEKKPYELFRAYGQSKLANFYFVDELARRLRGSASSIPVYMVHPGEVLTEVMRDMSPVIVMLHAIFKPVARAFMKSPVQGSFCTLHAATAPELATSDSDAHGRHLVRLSPAPMTDVGRSTANAAEVWALSERATAEFSA